MRMMILPLTVITLGSLIAGCNHGSGDGALPPAPLAAAVSPYGTPGGNQDGDADDDASVSAVQAVNDCLVAARQVQPDFEAVKISLVQSFGYVPETQEMEAAEAELGKLLQNDLDDPQDAERFLKQSRIALRQAARHAGHVADSLQFTYGALTQSSALVNDEAILLRASQEAEDAVDHDGRPFRRSRMKSEVADAY